MFDKWHNSSVEREYETRSLPPVGIGKDDSFEPIVEELVSAHKVAVDVVGRRKMHHAPSEFVLEVKAIPVHSKHLKVIATRAGGQWFISLVTEQGEVLRQYHNQYGPHPNPDGTIVGRSHKHFPTEQYPLQKGHKGIETWAYNSGHYPQDFVEAVKEFCEECNITIQALQERLDLRWF